MGFFNKRAWCRILPPVGYPVYFDTRQFGSNAGNKPGTKAFVLVDPNRKSVVRKDKKEKLF
jgi:hypothetical protein